MSFCSRSVCLHYSITFVSNCTARTAQLVLWLGLRAGWYGIRIPAEEKGFSFTNRPDRLWDLNSLLFIGYRYAFPRTKRSERQVGHSPKLLKRQRMGGAILPRHIRFRHSHFFSMSNSAQIVRLLRLEDARFESRLQISWVRLIVVFFTPAR